MPDEGIEKGLTVVVAMEFIPASELNEYFKKERKKENNHESD